MAAIVFGAIAVVGRKRRHAAARRADMKIINPRIFKRDRAGKEEKSETSKTRKRMKISLPAYIGSDILFENIRQRKQRGGGWMAATDGGVE